MIKLLAAPLVLDVRLIFNQRKQYLTQVNLLAEYLKAEFRKLGELSNGSPYKP